MVAQVGCSSAVSQGMPVLRFVAAGHARYSKNLQSVGKSTLGWQGNF
jgi:hypothetical protein